MLRSYLANFLPASSVVEINRSASLEQLLDILASTSTGLVQCRLGGRTNFVYATRILAEMPIPRDPMMIAQFLQLLTVDDLLADPRATKSIFAVEGSLSNDASAPNEPYAPSGTYAILDGNTLLGWLPGSGDLHDAVKDPPVFVCVQGHVNRLFREGECDYCPFRLTEITSVSVMQRRADGFSAVNGPDGGR
jgi:hypothetical protein